MTVAVPPRHETGIEWGTLAMIAATYLVWVLATGPLWALSPLLAFLAATLAIAQFSSLQHEVLHGHPTGNTTLNEAFVFPALTLFIPYQRFRDTHLAHHNDPILTDPYDDPESNYLDPAVWSRLSRPLRQVLRLNNTLAGRIVLGPAVSIWAVATGDLAAIRAGDAAVRRAWVLHAVGLVGLLVWLLAVGQMPLWAYAAAAYLGFGLLKIRTFLEHRAHETARARTVVIEDRGPLSVLFLNNNFHVVHHVHPGVAWHKLPGLYNAQRDHYLRRNDGYVYRSYADVFRRYFLTAKDPVPHPIMADPSQHWPRRTD